MGKPEDYVEGYLRRQATNRGWLCYKFTSPGTSGVPDRIVIGNGLVVFAELKAPGEKPRPLQVKRIRDMRKRGARVEVIDSREGVDELIESMERREVPRHAKS